MAKREAVTKDEHYDLVSVLYHALQGDETLGQYIDDAEGAGDEDLADHFRDIQEKYREIAQETKELLREKLVSGEGRGRRRGRGGGQVTWLGAKLVGMITTRRSRSCSPARAILSTALSARFTSWHRFAPTAIAGFWGMASKRVAQCTAALIVLNRKRRRADRTPGARSLSVTAKLTGSQQQSDDN